MSKQWHMTLCINIDNTSNIYIQIKMSFYPENKSHGNVIMLQKKGNLYLIKGIYWKCANKRKICAWLQVYVEDVQKKRKIVMYCHGCLKWKRKDFWELNYKKKYGDCYFVCLICLRLKSKEAEHVNESRIASVALEGKI